MPTMMLLVDGTIPVAATFNGNYAALNAAAGTGTTIVAYTVGDMVYASATNTLSRLAIGSAGQVLGVSGGIPAWQAASGVVDQLSGLAIASASATSLQIGIGAAASDDATYANRVMMAQTSALTGTTSGTWVVGNSQPKLDTGSIGNNQWWHVFSILRPDTGVVDILYSQSATAPTMPTNYTKKRRIGAFKTDGSAQVIGMANDGDYFYWAATVLDYNQDTGDTAAHSVTLTVPTGVNVWASVNTYVAGTNSTGVLYISDLAMNDETPSQTAAPLGMNLVINTVNDNQFNTFKVRTNTSAQVRVRMSARTASEIVRIATLGWWDRRGKG